MLVALFAAGAVLYGLSKVASLRRAQRALRLRDKFLTEKYRAKPWIAELVADLHRVQNEEDARRLENLAAQQEARRPKAFIDEFHKELNRQAAERDICRNQTEHDMEKTEREIRRLIEAIKSGVPGSAVRTR